MQHTNVGGWPAELTVPQLAHLQGRGPEVQYIAKRLQLDCETGLVAHTVKVTSLVVDSGFRPFRVQRNYKAGRHQPHVATMFLEKRFPEKREDVTEITIGPAAFDAWLHVQRLFPSTRVLQWFAAVNPSPGAESPDLPNALPAELGGEPYVLTRNLLVGHFQKLGWNNIENDLKSLHRATHAPLRDARTQHGCYVVAAVELWGRENGRIPIPQGAGIERAPLPSDPFRLCGHGR